MQEETKQAWLRRAGALDAYQALPEERARWRSWLDDGIRCGWIRVAKLGDESPARIRHIGQVGEDRAVYIEHGTGAGRDVRVLSAFGTTYDLSPGSEPLRLLLELVDRVRPGEASLLEEAEATCVWRSHTVVWANRNWTGQATTFHGWWLVATGIATGNTFICTGRGTIPDPLVLQSVDDLNSLE